MSIEVGPALGLTADSKSLEAALPVLDAVAKKAGAADVAADKLAGSTKRMGAEMAAAASKASATFSVAMDKASTAIDLTYGASTKLTDGFRTQVDAMQKAAQESAAYQAELDKVRAQFNPLFAASKQYEEQLERIAQAEQMGAISSREAAAARVAAEGGLASIGKTSTSVAPKMGAVAYQSRMVALQLSQVAQQTMAGGGFMRALAIQLPDMAMGFGTVGIAVGVLAGVALPLLSTALGGNTEKAEANAAALLRLKDAQEAVTKSTVTTQTEIDKLRFGVDEGYQVELLREQIRLRDEYNLKAAELNGYLASTTDSIDLQRIKTEQQRAELERIAAAYKANADSLNRQADRAAQLAIIEGIQAQRAGEMVARQRDAAAAAERMHENVRDLVGSIGDASSALGALVANAPKGGWLNGAIADAQRLATALWDSASAQAANRPSDSKLAGAYGLYAQTRTDGPASKAAQDAVAAAKGGGGAGGGTSALDTLVNELRTEQETLDLWRADNLAKISSYNDAELAAVGGQHEAKLRLEAEYQERLKAIIGQESNYRVTETAGMFSALADIASAGGRKALKAQAVLSAAATTIAGYEAAMKAAAEAKTIPGRIAAYAQFLGLGLKAASAIRTAGGAGGGSTGGTTASTASTGTTATAAATPQDVIIDYSATADPVMRALAVALVNPMIAQLQKASKTGINIVAVRS